MGRALYTTGTAVVLALGIGACQFGDPNDDPYAPAPSAECNADVDCLSHGGGACASYACQDGECKAVAVADGTPAPNFTGSSLRCQKNVCDGKGSTRLVPDPTAVPTDGAPSCKRYTCDATGNAALEPDPTNVPRSDSTPCQRATCDAAGNATTTIDASNVPTDTPNDCKTEQCGVDGTVVLVPNAADLPNDQAGDCMKDTCGDNGTFVKIVDDADVPAAETCFSHACSGGTATSTPINPTSNCSEAGYVCGADGSCNTCPAPDAACTDPGPGSRDQAAAHDYEGIGRTDTGGRYACGAVPSGQREYYTYYDNGTGFLASFDPYFELRPQAAAKMCVYFDCPTIECPAGTTSDTLSAQPGCCWDAAAGSFTGHQLPFCVGARVTVAISSTAACAAYEMHFHD